MFPKTLWDVVKEISDLVYDAKEDDNISKEELIESLENNLAIIISKLIITPTTNNFCMYA
jgi:hypothetical protein